MDKLANVEVIEKDRIFRLHYNIPVSLKSTLDMLVEQDIGYGDNLIINDVTEEVRDNRLIGYIEVETDNYDYGVIFDRASQLNSLSEGIDLVIQTNS